MRHDIYSANPKLFFLLIMVFVFTSTTTDSRCICHRPFAFRTTSSALLCDSRKNIEYIDFIDSEIVCFELSAPVNEPLLDVSSAKHRSSGLPVHSWRTPQNPSPDATSRAHNDPTSMSPSPEFQPQLCSRVRVHAEEPANILSSNL